MNILWLNHRDPKHPRAGGAERTIYEVAKRLVLQGNKVTLYCPKWKGSSSEDRMEGIRIIRKGNNFTTHLFLPIFLLKNKFDVVINDLAHGIPWISSVFLEKKNIVFFRHLHARSLPGQVNIILARIITLMEKMYPYIYRNAKIVTESSTSEKDLLKLGFIQSNIVRIPPGVDLITFFPDKKTQNVQLIYFGGFRRYKRPELLLSVYEQLVGQIHDLKIVVIGDGPLLAKIKSEALIKNYDIIFKGKIDQSELARLVRQSWVNLHFSITEGWGLSIVEASASGTPTVGLKAPGVVDTISDNINGFVVEEISQFEDAILKIIKNEDTMAKKSIEFAKHFNWDDTVSLWIKLL